MQPPRIYQLNREEEIKHGGKRRHYSLFGALSYLETNLKTLIHWPNTNTSYLPPPHGCCHQWMCSELTSRNYHHPVHYKSGKVCTSGRLSTSLQKVHMSPLVDLMKCGVGQPEAVTVIRPERCLFKGCVTTQRASCTWRRGACHWLADEVFLLIKYF